MDLITGLLGRMLSALLPLLRPPTVHVTGWRIGGEPLPHNELRLLRDGPVWSIDFEIVSDPPIVAAGIHIDWCMPGSRSGNRTVPLDRRRIALHAPYRSRPFEVVWMLVPDANGVLVDGPGVVVVTVTVQHRQLGRVVSERFVATIRLVRSGPEHGRIVVEEGDTSGPDDEPRNADEHDPNAPLLEI